MSWTVAGLLGAVADTLAVRFGALSVNGELSGFVRASSGHCYFSLKDADGQPGLIRCAMFRRSASLLDFQPADGQRVELRGRISVYEARGELQVVVETLRRQGAGTLYEEFLRLRAKLATQGLFDESRRRPIEANPSAIGIITSLGAAALHDVVTALQRRAPHVRIVIYPSPVQGAEAPAALAAALAMAGSRNEVDTLLLVRGGGSLEDLWSFNDERVVRAVSASAIPVICGVGHETDVTLSDLAADLRAATPTAAAELAAPAVRDLMAALDRRGAGLVAAVRRALDRQAQRVDMLAQRTGRPAAAMAQQRQRVHGLGLRLSGAASRSAQRAGQLPPALAHRLLHAGRQTLARGADRLQVLSARLVAAHPQQVLNRGYAWVVDSRGVPVMRVAGLTIGDELSAVFADGRARATVEEVDVVSSTGPLLPP